MKIQIYKNGGGLICGADDKRISCSIPGTLNIGTAEVKVSPDGETVMPLLFNGSTGDYKATFKSDLGNVYNLGRVSIKGGRIVPPSKTAVDIMELMCRVDALEQENEHLRSEVLRLSNIFDTDSLNFLIH